MKNIFYILLLVVIAYSRLYSQKEAYNWDFGGKWVITFDTPDGEPKILRESIGNMDEGCSSVSTPDGKFLFSTSGISAYTYVGLPDSVRLTTGQYIPFCTLLDHYEYQRAGQTGLIVKQPGNNNLYYVFSSMCIYETANYYHTRYSIIDMDGNDGRGIMLETDKDLFRNSGDKLIGIRHGNGKDVWVISHELNSRTFLSALLTEDGLSNDIIKSTADSDNEIKRVA